MVGQGQGQGQGHGQGQQETHQLKEKPSAGIIAQWPLTIIQASKHHSFISVPHLIR